MVSITGGLKGEPAVQKRAVHEADDITVGRSRRGYAVAKAPFAQTMDTVYSCSTFGQAASVVMCLHTASLSRLGRLQDARQAGRPRRRKLVGCAAGCRQRGVEVASSAGVCFCMSRRQGSCLGRPPNFWMAGCEECSATFIAAMIRPPRLARGLSTNHISLRRRSLLDAVLPACSSVFPACIIWHLAHQGTTLSLSEPARRCTGETGSAFEWSTVLALRDLRWQPLGNFPSDCVCVVHTAHIDDQQQTTPRTTPPNSPRHSRAAEADASRPSRPLSRQRSSFLFLDFLCHGLGDARLH